MVLGVGNREAPGTPGLPRLSKGMSLAAVAGMPRCSIVALSLATLAACVPLKRVPTCGFSEPQAIGFDQVLPDGTTARAFAERLPGSHRGSLKWFPSSQ
jgi:hypothetical protein